MVNLSIGTFNVKGLANDKKKKEIFYWLKGGKNEYLFSTGNTAIMKQNQHFSQIGEINVYFQIKTLRVQVI
jgi:hypothetical protein